MTYEMTISMDATKGQYLPQLFQLRKKLTRTKCASEKELINTQGAASLDSPSYQGEPGIGAGHGAHVRRGEGKDGRTDVSHGPAEREGRKPPPFSVTLVAAATAFTLMLSPPRKSMRSGNWQRNT